MIQPAGNGRKTAETDNFYRLENNTARICGISVLDSAVYVTLYV